MNFLGIILYTGEVESFLMGEGGTGQATSHLFSFVCKSGKLAFGAKSHRIIESQLGLG